MILVFGKTGQVASSLSRQKGVTAIGRDQADLSDPAACAAIIREAKPQAVINAAAYTAVDKAEEEEALAAVINGEAPGAMAAAAAELDVPFVHISTDYVFDGSGTAPWTPNQTTAPINAYGRSKLAGETAVAEAGGRFVILRTSWVFSGTGNNFAKTMLRLGQERDSLRIVDDQIGGPTYAPDIGQACMAAALKLGTNSDAAGIYHFTGHEDVSWADFARQIFLEAGISCQIDRIPTEEYPLPAARPLNSRLDCTSTREVLDIQRPGWVSGLRTMLANMRG